MEKSTVVSQYTNLLEDLSKSLDSGWKVYSKPTGRLTWKYFLREKNCLPSQGWKIHVSAAAIEAVSLCDVVISKLIEQQVNFKVAATVNDIIKINSGNFGRSQVGKVVTAYPLNNQEAFALAQELDNLWISSTGPVIPSDIQLRSRGAIFLRYGAFGTGKIIHDSAGRLHFALQLPDGSLTEDRRSEDGTMPSWVAAPPISYVAARAVHSNEVFVESRKYLPLSVLQSVPKGKVFLGLSLDACETVIIKTAQRGIFGDYRGFDARDRLKNEHKVLSALASEVRIAPRPIGLSDNEVVTLVMEDIKGQPLTKISKSEQIASLIGLAEAVTQLHKLGYVHRDIKLKNALLAQGKVWLIDFELAASISSKKPIPGGTPGYVPPEATDDCVSLSSDVYALGICIAHAILGQDPATLPYGRGRLIGLLVLTEAHRGAKLVKCLTVSNPENRPSATEAVALLKKEVGELTSVLGYNAKRFAKLATRNWCQRAVWEAADATRRYIDLKKIGHSWQNCHYQSDFSCEGINIGAAGIILGLISVEHALGIKSFRDDIVAGANWLVSRSPDDSPSGFFTGNAGVALTLAVTGMRLNYSHFLESSRSRLVAAALPSSNFDLFAGGAGVVWAGCLIADILKTDWPLDVIQDRAEAIIKAAKIQKGVIVWDSPKELESNNLPYVGAGHGSAGIAAALAIWGNQVGCNRAIELALDTFQSIYAYARSTSGTAIKKTLGTKKSDSASNGFWCHGTAGYLWSILQSLGDHSALREQIDWATEAFSTATPIANPTYCHGLSGHLELWRMLQSIPRHEELAQYHSARIAATLRLLHQRTGNRCVWCSETPEIVTPDLWIGFLGPATALALYTAKRKDALFSSSWLKNCVGYKE